jgi:HlyD family secretion protein
MELLKKTQSTTTVAAGNGGVVQQTSTKTVVEKLKKKKKRNRWIWISLAALVLFIVILAIVKGGKEKTITVQVEVASRRTITEVVQATGKIQPEFKVKIAPEVSGEIVSLPFKEGARVQQGQLLAKIKPTSFEAQYSAAVSQLQASKSRVEQMRAQRIQAELALKRIKELQGKGLAAASEVEQAQAAFDIADANIKAAQFDVAATQSQLKTYAESLRKTSVVAPMSGVITQLISQLGEKVVGTSQFSGTEIMTVSDLSVMNAEVEVDENDVVNISVGDTSRVTIDAFPGRIFSGTVVEIANSAKLKGLGTQDQSTNFAVKIRLLGFNEGELRPGMSCTAKIETETKNNVVAVPIMAVTRRTKEKAQQSTDITSDEQQVSELAKKAEVTPKQDEAPTIVFIVENGKAKSIPVKTGISDNSYVEILSGIKGTEEVIKGNYAAVSKELQNGSAVKVEGAKTKSSEKK